MELKIWQMTYIVSLKKFVYKLEFKISANVRIPATISRFVYYTLIPTSACADKSPLCYVGIEGKLTEADESIKRLENWQNNCKIEKEQHAFEEKMKYEIKLHETELKLESEHKAKIAEEKISKEACLSQVEAKLPKLVISKFNGDFMDWQRFWGQFTESIEKSGLASISKFSYLKEPLGDSVKREVDSSLLSC